VARCGAVRCARRELHGRARLVRAEHAGGREKERDKCLGRGKGSRGDGGGRGAWRGETRRNRELFLVSTHDPPRSSRLVLLLSSVSRRALGKLIPIKASRYASAVVQEVGAEFIVSAATSGRSEEGERKRGERHDGVIRRMRSPRGGGNGATVMADEGLDGSRDKLRRNRAPALILQGRHLECFLRGVAVCLLRSRVIPWNRSIRSCQGTDPDPA